MSVLEIIQAKNLKCVVWFLTSDFDFAQEEEANNRSCGIASETKDK